MKGFIIVHIFVPPRNAHDTVTVGDAWSKQQMTYDSINRVWQQRTYQCSAADLSNLFSYILPNLWLDCQFFCIVLRLKFSLLSSLSQNVRAWVLVRVLQTS